MAATPPSGQTASPHRSSWAPADAPLRIAPPPRQRSPMLMVVAVLIILIFAALGGIGYLRAGDRSDVLAVARLVPMGQQITTADLRRARVAADAAVPAIPVAQASQVIGKTATTTLLPGMLLIPEAITPAPTPGPGRALVGLELSGAQLPLPADQLPPGATVQLVHAPAGEAARPVTEPNRLDSDTVLLQRAEVYGVRASPGGDTIHVAVLVDQAAAPGLLRAAAAREVAVAILPAGGA